MKGIANSKQVVTSGRLTGTVKVQLARSRVIPDPGPAPLPEPAYSLYSTDSEDQVTSLHKGLDQCAALLSGFLQAEKDLPSLPRVVKCAAAKLRPSNSLGKKTTKKPPTRTAPQQKSCQSVQHGPGSTTPTTRHQPAVPAAHSGVKLHPSQKQTRTQFPPLHCQTLQHFSHSTTLPGAQTFISPPQPTTPPLQSSIPPSQPTTSPPQISIHPFQPSIAPPQSQTPIPPSQPTSHSGSLPLPQTDCQSVSEAPHTAECDRVEEDFVPVRDINAQRTATHSHIHSCTFKMSNIQLGPGQVDRVCQDTYSRGDCSAGTEVKVKTVQYLLGELKALITGQGSVVERLLSHLEQTLSSPLMNVRSSNTQTEPDQSPLHSQNTQLCSFAMDPHQQMRVRILHKQLKEREKAERQQNMDTFYNSEVLFLQEKLTTAQLQLQELQDDLTELRKALQDTQSELRDKEAQNALIKSDLEATRNRLLDSERAKNEFSSLAQQRFEEIGHLNRALQSQKSSDCTTVAGSSVSETLQIKQHSAQHQHRQDPAEPLSDRITQYLLSLGQLESTHTQDVCVATETEGNALEQNEQISIKQGETSSHPDARSQRGKKPAETSARHQNSHLSQSHCSDNVQSCGRLLNSTLSQCDVESVWSDWSTRSGSTLDTRDEAAFRHGLSALDASIASLQKTIQLDLGR